jgi:hypothetical protein
MFTATFSTCSATPTDRASVGHLMGNLAGRADNVRNAVASGVKNFTMSSCRSAARTSTWASGLLAAWVSVVVMEPTIIRAKPDARLVAIVALAGVGGTLIILQIWLGILLVILAAVFIYLVGRRAVLFYPAGVFVRGYVGTTQYRWSRVAGFGTTTDGAGRTIAEMHLLKGEDVPLLLWTDPDPSTVQLVDAEARRRQSEL